MAYLGAGITRFNTADGLTVKGTAEFTDTVVLGDSDELRFGESADLKIYHDASNSYIHDAGTGALIVRSNSFQAKSADNTTTMFTGAESGAVELYHNNVKRIETTSSGATITGDLTLTQHLEMGDNDEIRLGDSDNGVIKSTGQNLQIFAGSGGIQITNYANDQDVDIRTDDGSGGTALYFKADGSTGAAELYNYGSVKLATTSSGIDVTGTAITDGLTVDASGGGLTFSGGGNTFISATSSPLIFQTSSGTERMRITGTGNVGIGTTSPTAKLELSKGSAGSLVTFTDGVSTNFNFSTSGTVGSFGTDAGSTSLALKTSGSERLRIDSSGNVGIGTSSPGDAKLYVEGGQVIARYDHTTTSLSGNTNLTAFPHSLAVYNGNGTGTTNLASIGFSIDTTGSVTNGAIVGHSTAAGSMDLAFYTESSNAIGERVRITSGGNVGIGTTSPDQTLHVHKGSAGSVSSASSSVITVENNADAYIQFLTPNTASQQIRFGDPQDNGIGILSYHHTDNSMRFATNGPEKMRLSTNGYLQVGQNTSNNPGQGNSVYGLSLRGDGRVFASADGAYSLGLNRSDSGELTNFSRAGSFKGSINISTSSVSYNTTSDHRLKQNVVDMTGAIDRVKALAPKRFDFISDAGNTVDGFLAHEAQTVVPEAVTGTHNEVDDDGNPKYQQIDQAKLVPVLTAALKEAIAKIETLETEVAALKAAN